MKKVLKIAAWVLGILLLLVSSLLLYVSFALPNVGKAENIKSHGGPERIERGKYLANSVTVCIDCHSERDWSKFSGPLKEGTFGKGGEKFSQEFGFPGKFYAKNITPAGLKDWTDGEILRAIASGVSKSGKALFPIMPHPSYGKMDREDLYDIIAYLRSLESIENKVPESKPDFPMNFIINTIPQKAAYSKKPSASDKIAYGKYLFNAAACADCHTKMVKGAAVKGMELAGGFEFPMPSGGIVRSSNITPDEETGIGSWSEEAFVNRFKAYGADYVPASVEKGKFNTVMPWTMYGKMKEEDIRAIYAYLKTVKPVKNKVERFTP